MTTLFLSNTCQFPHQPSSTPYTSHDDSFLMPQQFWCFFFSCTHYSAHHRLFSKKFLFEIRSLDRTIYRSSHWLFFIPTQIAMASMGYLPLPCWRTWRWGRDNTIVSTFNYYSMKFRNVLLKLCYKFLNTLKCTFLK